MFARMFSIIVKVPPYTAPSSGGTGPVGSVVGAVVGAVVAVVVVASGSPQPVISNPLIDMIAIRKNRIFFIFSPYLLEILGMLNCGQNLYWDKELLYWKCRNKDCRHIYTYEDLYKKQPVQETEREKVKKKLKSYWRTKHLIILIATFATIVFLFIIWLLVGNQIIGLI